MSRVDEAIRRAAAAPRLAATSHHVAERAAERWDRSVLDHYPVEEGTAIEQPASPINPVSPDGPLEVRVPPAVSAGYFPERTVSARFGNAYQGKLVADGGAPLASIEEY